MNLAEFIEQTGIECKESEDFAHSPEFFKEKEFEKTCHAIYGIPFLEPETYQVKEFDVMLRGFVQEKWDKHEKRAKRQFFVNRSFRYPGMVDGFDIVEDAVPTGKTIDEAIEGLEAERQRFEFFKRYDLIDTGRYWLNRDLKRCLVDNSQVIVID